MAGAFGKPDSFSGSSSMFGTTSTGSHNPFVSTTSRGSFGGLSSSVFGQGSGSAASLSVFGNNSVHNVFTSTSVETATIPSFPIQRSLYDETSTGVFGAPSISFPTSLSLGFGKAPERAFGSSAAVGPINNKSNDAVAFKPFNSMPTSQTTWSSFRQTNSNALGTMPLHLFSSSSSAASPSLSTGSLQSICGPNTGSRISSYRHTIVEGFESSGCKLMSISAMPFYESKSHEELRWEDYELKSGGQQNAVNNQGLEIKKQWFEFPLPSFTSSLSTLSPPCTVPALSTNMNTQTSLIPCLTKPVGSQIFPASYNNTPASTGSGSDQDASTNNLQNLQLPSIESRYGQVTTNKLLPYNGNSMKHMTESSPLTAPPISAGYNEGVSIDIGQTQPSPLQQIFTIAGVKESIVAVKDPFGSERTNSLPSIGLSACSFVQHGISSMPVVNKPEKTRVSSVLTSKHHSLKPLVVNVRKYHPNRNAPKVPFFQRVEEIHNTSKAYSYNIIPRENPRAVFAAASEESELMDVSNSKEEAAPLSHESAEEYEHGTDSFKKDRNDHFAEANDNSKEEQFMPKLQRSDYYTDPEIKKLASIESLNPGFCCRVEEFVVGRVGYGWVKFYGETDIRGLDLDSIIHFNNQEVIVYDDDNEKPPVGQGLNKAAEVTLLNIKCNNKKTGKQYISGKMVDDFIEKLKRVTKKQGAEFVSYDPVKGEWKFSVQHF